MFWLAEQESYCERCLKMSFELKIMPRVRDISNDTNFIGYQCFVDESWKYRDKYSGTWWYCTSSNGEASTMRTSNMFRSLTPLNTKVEALLWAMMCIISADNQDVVFFTDYSDLVFPYRMVSIFSLLGRFA